MSISHPHKHARYSACRWRAVLAAALSVAFALGSPAGAGDRDDDIVRVMTRNIYQGTDLTPILAAPPAQLPAAAATAYTNILVNTNPAERMSAIAREIVKNKIDLVGLQEVFILRDGPLQAPTSLTFLPATNVVVDSLQLLLSELAKRGERYDVVAIVPGLDAELPAINPPLVIDARLTVRDVIIVRSRSELKLSNVQVQGFLRNRSFPSASGVTIPTRAGGHRSTSKRRGASSASRSSIWSSLIPFSGHRRTT